MTVEQSEKNDKMHAFSGQEMSQLLERLEPWGGKVSIETSGRYIQLSIHFLEGVKDRMAVIESLREIGGKWSVLVSEDHQMVVRVNKEKAKKAELAPFQMSMLLDKIEPWGGKVSIEREGSGLILNIACAQAIEDASRLFQALKDLGESMVMVGSSRYAMKVRIGC